MGTTLAQAYVQVIPTTKGIKGMLGKELGNEGDSGGKTTGMKFTGAFKKAIAAAGIGTALAKTISEGAKLEQSIGGVETLFGKKDAETHRYTGREKTGVLVHIGVPEGEPVPEIGDFVTATVTHAGRHNLLADPDVAAGQTYSVRH